MFRSKWRLIAAACLLCRAAWAESPNIISPEMIRTETVNYASTAVVETGEYARHYSVSATEFYPHTLTLFPETDSASFLTYHVSRSQQVSKGDVLATFALDVDQAALTSARLSLQNAQKEYEEGLAQRRKALNEQMQAHKSQTDAYGRERSALEIARAQIDLEQYCYQQECRIEDLARALEELEQASSQSHLIAPFDGVVTALTYKREGEKVYRNEGLITLSSQEDMLLRIANDQLHFRYGMPVTVASGANNNRTNYEGRVVAADNMLSQNRRSGEAYIQLYDVPADARLTRLSVTGACEYLADVMLVPRRAVTMEDGKRCVECLVNGALQKRYVNIGLSNMSEMWVVQGLETGDTVILD